jgi:CRISPR system Cascade subunit CasB
MMTTTIGQGRRNERLFIEALVALYKQEDRAALAALRRGLGRPPGETMEMYPYVAPYTKELTRKQEDAYYFVAALFGLYPGENWTSSDGRLRTNLGASLQQLANPNESSRESSKSVERRFAALLNAHSDDLSEHLRQNISLLKSKDIPVDWRQLLRDVINWDDDDRLVQRDWSKAFWGAGTQESSNDTTTTTDASTTTQDQN